MLQICIEAKKNWLSYMLERYGSVAKIAFIDDRPIAQLLYYPEESIPYLDPRPGVIRVFCIYNPYPEYRNKGIAKKLIRYLIEESRRGEIFREIGEVHSLVAADVPFKREEYYSQVMFFKNIGFREISPYEYAYLIKGRELKPIKMPKYVASEEDRGKAFIFYEPQCEFLPIVAHKIREEIINLATKYDREIEIKILNSWKYPHEYVKKGFNNVVINGVPIKEQYGTLEFLNRLDSIISSI